MDREILAGLFVVFLFGLLALGIPVGVVILVLAGCGIAAVVNVDVWGVMSTAFQAQLSTWGLTALPLFVLMGEVLGRSRTAERMFDAFVPFLAPVPGGLLQVNIFASGLFAALSGSSTATVATIGKLCYPQLAQRRYPDLLSIGSLAGSGTLGILIPPSIAMILYGFAADVSISSLFLAGILPGLVIVALFSIYVGWRMRGVETDGVVDVRLGKGRAMLALLPFFVLIVLVMGSIYTGIATPTEAAVVGVLGAVALAALDGSLSRAMMRDALRATVLFSAAIGFVLGASAALQVAMAYTGLPRTVVSWVAAAELGTYGLLAVVALILILLGCFIDGLSIILLTSAVLLPIVKASGVDMIWFGVFMVVLVEIGLITPPIGFNLFVLQRVTGKELHVAARASVPFILLLLVALVIFTVFPQIVTLLPGLL